MDLVIQPNETICILRFQKSQIIFTISLMKILRACTAVFILISLLTACQDRKTQLGHTNIIVVMTDDQGYGDLACHGNTEIITPNLDALHAQSVRLTNFHVGTTCSPTRAALMTGKNCNRVGVWHTIGGRSQLSRKEQTMADIFKNHGYTTGMIGKWHLGDSYPFRPHDRGFDDSFYHGGGGVWQMTDYWDNDYFDDTYFRNGIPEKTEGYCTDVWFDEAIDFVQQHQEDPFLLYLATNAPHGPFHVDSSYIKMYAGIEGVRANFYGMITNIDDNVGRLQESLTELGLDENTVFVFMTDNGTARGVRFDAEGKVQQGYNSGMRGIKGSEYEGGHRVPCFIRYPNGAIGGGRDIDHLTAHVDLLPTFMELAGIETPVDLGLEGRSLKPLLNQTEENPDDWDDRIFITDTQRDEFAEKWKRSSIMMNNWRLVNRSELYNVSTDPGQQNNIAAQHPDIINLLRTSYEVWWIGLQSSLDDYTRAIIGSSGQESNVLYSHDWHESKDQNGASATAPWNQTHIRQGPYKNGFWEVEIAESGKYAFELRRWPREAGVLNNQIIPVKQSVAGGSALPEGKSMDISSASIQIGDRRLDQSIKPNQENIVFEIQLDPGPARISAELKTRDGNRFGPYYVYVSKT